MGSIMTNKYAEGYPGKRYYGGCEFHDEAENLARDRLKKLFGAEYANVQPHSGTQANMAVYFAYMNLGEKILSMKLNAGRPPLPRLAGQFTGKFYQVAQYSVDPETEMLDYGMVAEMAKKEKPQIIVCGASAYPRTIDFKAFQEIADDVGAYCMADIAHIAGLCATGAPPELGGRGQLHHHHHPQDPPRSPGRRDHVQCRVRALQSTRRSSPACRAAP